MKITREFAVALTYDEVCAAVPEMGIFDQMRLMVNAAEAVKEVEFAELHEAFPAAVESALAAMLRFVARGIKHTANAEIAMPLTVGSRPGDLVVWKTMAGGMLAGRITEIDNGTAIVATGGEPEARKVFAVRIS